MKPYIEINGKRIFKEGRELYLIAEIGVNYYDIAEKEGITPFDAAVMMIREAASAGVNAVKFQIYKAEKLASKFSPAYWDTTKEPTRSQYELFSKYDKLSYDDYAALAEECRKNNVDFLYTPFDEEAVDVLEEVVPAYKVASADITNLPLLKKIASKGKPVILSTGAATISEIWQALEWMRDEGNENIAVLHCVLSYPNREEDANLGMIRHLNRVFSDFVVGYSDHVPPHKNLETLVFAYLLGANIIEKHFTLDKSLKGNDHYHAMDPEDIRKFHRLMDLAMVLYGNDYKKPLKVEYESRKYARRSIVAARKIKAGERITQEDITVKRPGTGISPVFIDMVIGRRAVIDIEEDEILQWRMID